MKLSDNDIIRSARRQAEAQNARLTPKPWAAPRRLILPWAASLAAAVATGFAIGFFTPHTAGPLTENVMTRVDTVYLTQPSAPADNTSKKQESLTDTTRRSPEKLKRSWKKPSRSPSVPTPQPADITPLSRDNIRYDLLAQF